VSDELEDIVLFRCPNCGAFSVDCPSEYTKTNSALCGKPLYRCPACDCSFTRDDIGEHCFFPAKLGRIEDWE